MTRLLAALLALLPLAAQAQTQGGGGGGNSGAAYMVVGGSNATAGALAALAAIATGCNDVTKLVSGTGTCVAVSNSFTGSSGDILTYATASTNGSITPASGIATFLATPSGANLAAALTTALPATKGGTGLTSLGTGVATALGVNTGSAGAFVVLGGAGGTPSSLIGTNITGTAAGLTAGSVTTNANLTGDITSSGNATTLAAGSASNLNSGTLPAARLVAANMPVTPLATGTSVSLAAPRQYYVCTGTCTVTPPVPAAGYEFCVLNDDNVATVITLAALGSSARYETTARTGYGTAGTGTFVSGGAAADKMCLLGLDSTHYLVASSFGTWTAN